MNLEIVILSEMSDTERQISYINNTNYMWNLEKKLVQMKVYTTL